MSDPQSPAPADHPSTLLSVLMILGGIILLLPGVCAGFFMIAFSMDLSLVPLWLICFLIAAGGIVLIWWAVRRLRA